MTIKTGFDVDRTMRASRILAVVASVVIIVGLLLPIYSLTLRLPLQGLGEFHYEVDYSLLGTAVRSSIGLDREIPLNVEKYVGEADGPLAVKELLSGSGLPDVKGMAEEAGFPVDVSMLPVDLESLSRLAASPGTITEIPLISSEADLQSYIPNLPSPLSTIPIADIVSLGLRFGPLIFIIPPFIGIARGRYGKAASTFILLLILPLIIPFFIPIMAVSVNIGWYVMFLGSTLLVAASITRRRERKIKRKGKPSEYTTTATVHSPPG